MTYSFQRSLVVFSCPNHELAVFGLLQRIKPQILFLTDGGDERRVAETKEGLARLGLLERATFLNHRTQTLYERLLQRDNSYFAMIADQIGELIEEVKPRHLLCDAVEYYNPIHDLTVPLVKRALGDSPASIMCVPLLYQKRGVGESYEFQRVTPAEEKGSVKFYLNREELKKKTSARDNIYTVLRGRLGPLLYSLPEDHGLLEVLLPLRAANFEPHAERVLRYEWFGEQLWREGRVAQKITFEGHYLPVVETLLTPQVVLEPAPTEIASTFTIAATSGSNSIETSVGGF